MWEGDKIFLRLLEENVPFFSLKLQYQGRPAGPGGAEWEADCMIPALTLEPLSWDDLPEAAVLWADPAVIRWTNIAAPCTEAGAADRLEHLLDCQRGLPFSTVFALREGRHSGDWPAARRWIRPPGSMGCSTSRFPPAGAGAWDLRLRRRHCGAWNGWHRPWCWQTRWQRIPPASGILERLGFVRTAVHHRAFCREGRMLDIWDYARRWAGPAETV